MQEGGLMRAGIILCSVLICLVGCSGDPSSPGAVEADVLLLADALFPSWSPDSSGLICNRAVTGLEHCVWWIAGVGGVSDTLFVDASGEYGPWYPEWMPDGQRVVYHRTRERTLESVYEFVIHDLDGGDPVVWEVPDFWHDAAFTLVPDGSEVLYTTLSSTRQIWALDLENGATRLVRDGQTAAASPDGQWIAFAKDDTIRVAPFGDGEDVKYEMGWSPAWTPDSQYIVFSGYGASGNPDLIIVSMDGSYRRQLTDDPDWDLHPAVAPQGDKVAYVKTVDDDYGPFNLRILSLDLD
jgi:hypothetical protein